MTTLGEKIEKLCEWDEPGGLAVSMPEKTGSPTIVHTTIPKDARKAAKCRYLSYFCRKAVRSQLGIEKETYNLQLDSELERLLDTEAVTVTSPSRLEVIENRYKAAANNDIDRLDLTLIEHEVTNNKRYAVEKLGMIGLYRNRALFIWDIVWGLFTVYSSKLDPVIDNLSSDQGQKALDLLFENVERRLRKIERMRYNVSDRLEGVRLESGVADGHTLRMFEYPDDYQGFSEDDARTEINSKARDSWKSNKHPKPSKDNVLTEGGKQDPLLAIKQIFEPYSDPDKWQFPESRNIGYCDRVIHILHLEDIAFHLTRTKSNGDARSILKTMKERIAIDQPWKKAHEIGSASGYLINNPSGILVVGDRTVSIDAGVGNLKVCDIVAFEGDGQDYILTEEFLEGENYIRIAPGLRSVPSDNSPVILIDRRRYLGTGVDDDPYFERLEGDSEARMDELIPGDHVYIRSHPAYSGFGKGFAWRLENVLVTRFRGMTTPRDIEVQGHGVEPKIFRDMQLHMIEEFALGHQFDESGYREGGLRDAQRRIDLCYDGESDLPDYSNATEIEARMIYAYGNRSPFGRNPEGLPYTLLDVAIQHTNNDKPFIYGHFHLGIQSFPPDGPKGPIFKRGIIEFRNEFYDDSASTNNLACFWARWVLISYRIYPGSSALFDYAKQDGRYLEFFHDEVISTDETPFIERIELENSLSILTLHGENLSKERVIGIYFVSDTTRQLIDDGDQLSWSKSPEVTSLLATHGQSLNYFDQLTLEFVSGTNDRTIKVLLPIGWQPDPGYWKPVIVTSIGIEIRAESSFYWPPNTSKPIKTIDYINVAYFPLFKTGVQRISLDLEVTSKEVQKFYRESSPEQTIRVIRPRFEDLT